jgi:hypothetical protein
MSGDVAIAKELLPEKEVVNRVKALIKSTDAAEEKINGLFVSMTQAYYDAGEIISNWAQGYHGRITRDVLEQAFRVSSRKINTAVKVYRTFQKTPGMIANTTLADALALYKVRKEAGERQRIEYAGDENAKEYDWDALFDQKPLAKVKLKNYRVQMPNDHELYIVKKGINQAIKTAEIYAVAKSGNNALNLAHEELLRDCQKAVEKYYSVYEREENTQEETE